MHKLVSETVGIHSHVDQPRMPVSFTLNVGTLSPQGHPSDNRVGEGGGGLTDSEATGEAHWDLGRAHTVFLGTIALYQTPVYAERV